ncbi:hypothetical protein SAMN05216251_113158 [Actinacidiphila alni]|uniref:ATP-binding protein n=1 Tax=Actinacidiphila alni TaxID=380248 RepID=A0A1I2IHI2_9ACTN|nr:ATP-binding protein [Actinacidiphila alni]SFF41088.1 hypothetical protein SAMN05216251_113158 [Actinacidiphila alni]
MHRSATTADGLPRQATPDDWAGAAYDGESGSIAAARAFTADFLTARTAMPGAAPLGPTVVADAQLVVSELVTNACKFAPGPCALNLELLESVLEITLWDSDATLPFARATEPGRIGKHGLEIVLALCEGFDVRREAVGKRIKVRIALGE